MISRVCIEIRVQDTASAQALDQDERFVALANEVASLRDHNASLRDELAKAHESLANLRVRYRQLLEELYLSKRRLFVAKAERTDDVADAQLAFDLLLAQTEAIEKVLDAAPSERGQQDVPPEPKGPTTRSCDPEGPTRSIPSATCPRCASRSRTPSSRAKPSASASRWSRASPSSAADIDASFWRASCTRSR